MAAWRITEAWKQPPPPTVPTVRLPSYAEEVTEGISVPRAALVPAALFGMAVVFFLIYSPFSSIHFPLDDAWIHRVYARSFATGAGFAYNPGVQEAGETSPLWTIVSAPVHWFSVLGPGAVVLMVKCLGALLGMVGVFLLLRALLISGGTTLVAVIGASLFVLEPRLIFSALSGMENMLLLSLWFGVLFYYLDKRWFLSALLLGLMPVTRPEAVMLFPFWVVGLVFVERAERPSLKQFASCGVALIPTFLFVLFCLSVNGHPLPNTAYAKATVEAFDLSKLSLVWEIVSQSGFAATPTFFLGLIAFLVWVRRLPRFEAVTLTSFLLVVPTVYALSVAFSRQMSSNGYYWTRWVDPASLLLTACCCIGLGAIVQWVVTVRSTRLRWVVGAVSVMTLLASASPFWNTFAERRARLASDSYVIYNNNVRPGLWLARHTERDAVIGVQDAGAIHYFSNRRSVDLLGLNSKEVTFGLRPAIDVIGELDWLAVYPVLMSRLKFAERFERVHSFEVTPEQLTTCTCPDQLEVVMYRHRRSLP